MDFQDYQHKAQETAIYPDSYKIIYPALGLAEEAGEVCGKLKKVIRDKHGIFLAQDVGEIKKEIGDVLWYLAALCTDLEIRLEDVALLNIEKLKKRKEEGCLGGSGDNR